VAERSPRLDVVRVMSEPAARNRRSHHRSTLHLAGLLDTDVEHVRQLTVMGRPAGRDKVLQDRGKRTLDQVLINHVPPLRGFRTRRSRTLRTGSQWGLSYSPSSSSARE